MLGLICPEVRRILFWSELSVPIDSPLESTTWLFFCALYCGKVVDRRQVLGDRGHHPEDHRDDGEDPEPEQHEEEPQLFEARLGPFRWAGCGGGERGAGRGRRNLAAVAASTLE